MFAYPVSLEGVALERVDEGDGRAGSGQREGILGREAVAAFWGRQERWK